MLLSGAYVFYSFLILVFDIGEVSLWFESEYLLSRFSPSNSWTLRAFVYSFYGVVLLTRSVRRLLSVFDLLLLIYLVKSKNYSISSSKSFFSFSCVLIIGCFSFLIRNPYLSYSSSSSPGDYIKNVLVLFLLFDKDFLIWVGLLILKSSCILLMMSLFLTLLILSVFDKLLSAWFTFFYIFASTVSLLLS